MFCLCIGDFVLVFGLSHGAAHHFVAFFHAAHHLAHHVAAFHHVHAAHHFAHHVSRGHHVVGGHHVTAGHVVRGHSVTTGVGAFVFDVIVVAEVGVEVVVNTVRVIAILLSGLNRYLGHVEIWEHRVDLQCASRRLDLFIGVVEGVAINVPSLRL